MSKVKIYDLSAYKLTRNAIIKSGTFIPLDRSSQVLYPGIRKPDQIQANNDWFAATFSVLTDRGIAESPDNSYPTLLKDQARKGWIVE